jgi:outer membrane protein TolC
VKKILTAAALLLLALQIPFAETSYDLTKIVELTLRENATLKRNSIELNALKRKSDKRWATIVPALSVGASAARTEELPAFAGAVNATASLSISASAFSDIGQTRLNYEAGSITSAATIREVELSVRKSFFLILYEQEYVDYLKRTVDTARRQYELTAKNQQEGLVPILDTLAAQVNYQNATLTLAAAESACRNDLAALKQAAGIPQNEEVRLIGSLESSLPKAGIKVEGIGPASSAYALLEKKLEAARFARRMSGLSVWAPTLACSVGTRNVLQATTASEAPFTPNVSVSLVFPVGDLLPWSTANEAALAADDSIKDIELQLSAAKTADSSKFDSLLQDIENAERTIETRRLTVSLAEESYRLTEEAFKAGSKDFIALKSSADALQEAKTGLIKERYGLISSVMDLEYLCGVPFGSLSEEK